MSNYIYYIALYNNEIIGKYRFNQAYNTLLELAKKVSEKIYQINKPKKFNFKLIDVQQKVTYIYSVDMTYFTFLEYGDYRIGHDRDVNNCDTYHPNVILPKLVQTIYPDMKVEKLPYWQGEEIPGLRRDDVFNYIHGKWY